MKLTKRILVWSIPLALAACSASDITAPLHYSTTMVSVGSSFTCALKGGAVKCWGAGSFGQLGNGANSDALSPVSPVGLPSNVTAVSTGAQHTCVIARGGVRCWGDNAKGQVGLAAGATYNTPQITSTASLAPGGTVAFLGSGLTYSCAIPAQTVSTSGASLGTYTGSVVCWGDQLNGQLGNGALGAANTPTAVANAGLAALPFFHISIGDQHGCASANGGVYCWGSDSAGELQNETTTAGVGTAAVGTTVGVGYGVSVVAAGLKHTCAVVGTGIKCWGDNTYGQLGNNSNSPSQKPVDVTGLAGAATAVYAGGNSTCAVAGGQLQCWGYNASGQLGDGSTTNRSTPVSTGLSGKAVWVSVATTGHTCAAVDDQIYCWGGNGNGQLGNGSTTPSQSPSLVGF